MYKDERIINIAKTVTKYSINVQKGEKVLIKASIDSKELVMELVKDIYELGGYPYVRLCDEEIERCIYEGATKELFQIGFSWDEKMYDEIDCYIMIRSIDNDAELSEIDSNKILQNAIVGQKITDKVIQNKKWCLLQWPTKGTAQNLKMSYDKCVDYMFNACTADYNEISLIGNKLRKIMLKTDRVKILKEGTNLEFSIKNCEVAVTAGKYNLPDGEVATAPVINSLNGYITFNTKSIYNGTLFSNVKLTFKNGKIININADNDIKNLEKIFDTDYGSRYIGEFAFGLNPLTTKVIGIALYDEKIKGSIHIAAGKSLPGLCDNGNRSAIHWDLVQIHTKEHGGGKIYFDDRIIMEDGVFKI